MNISLRFFARTFLLLSFIFCSYLDSGVDSEALVQTPKGPQKLGILKVGDKVLCLSKDLVQEEKEITRIEDEEEEETTEITTEDNVLIYTSKGQRVFVPQKRKWVKVSKLKSGQSLLKKDGSEIKIKDVKKKLDKRMMRYISVDEHHNFFVGENGLLVHNMAADLLRFVGAAVVKAVEEAAKVTAYVVAKEKAAEITKKFREGFVGETNFPPQGLKPESFGGIMPTPPVKPDPLAGVMPTPINLDPLGGTAPVFDDLPRDPNGGIIFAEKAPGNPQNSPGADKVFEPKKGWDGKKVPSPHGRGWGYPDKDERVWVPTGENGHGGPHWDVQPRGGKGKHVNIMPDGTVRGEKK